MSTIVVNVSLTNEDKGYSFNDFQEYLENEDGYYTHGRLYKLAQREYGRCQSKVYVDTNEGPKHVGWFFVSRQQYDDCEESYLQGAWVMYQEYEQ